jgi:hypothetical protein
MVSCHRLWSPRPRGFLITHNDAPQSVGLLWTSDQLVAEISTLQHTQQTNFHYPVGLEPTIAVGRRPQTYALDRAATGTGVYLLLHTNYKNKGVPQHIFVIYIRMKEQSRTGALNNFTYTCTH